MARFPRFQRLFAFALVMIGLCLHEARAQIYHVQDMTSPEIAALDRAHTAVILVGGIIEEHGPALPVGADTFMNEWWAQSLAETIVQRPGWKVLIFPTMALGTSGANVLGSKYVYPGTFSIRPETERALFMDLASEIGEQGFRWVFVFHNHGSPIHNLMVDQASDFFHDSYGGVMVNLPGLIFQAPPLNPRAQAVVREEGEFEVHAGMSETSRLLFLKPQLVAPLATLAPNKADTPAEAVRIARTPGWQGYIGSPRLASAAFGAQEMAARGQLFNRTALAILDGADPRSFLRLSVLGLKNPDVDKVEQGTQAWAREIEAKQQAWLKKQGH